MAYLVLTLVCMHERITGCLDQGPYITYGYKEHLDVLGVVDYLFAKYPTKFNSTIKPKLGIFGVSMGGATSMIAYA